MVVEGEGGGGGEAPGPVKNGVNFSSYGKAKNGLSMATERVLKGGNTEHAISDPLFVGALSHTHAHAHTHTHTVTHVRKKKKKSTKKRPIRKDGFHRRQRTASARRELCLFRLEFGGKR